LATKSGIKYEDVNFSGDYEPGTDTLLANWTIYAYRDIGTTPGELDAGDTLVASTLTNANGQYSFNLAPGDYIIVEELRSGWLQSEPTTDVNGGTQNRAENGYAISLGSGQNHTDNDFGNYRLATKSGIKYEDVNFSGDYEPGTDTLLANWTIYAYRDDRHDAGRIGRGRHAGGQHLDRR
jgi:hypothetical protein